jgi:hypothetical protein
MRRKTSRGAPGGGSPKPGPAQVEIAMSYKGSVTRIEKLSKVVLAVVMLFLAGFLIALGNKLLSDCDGWIRRRLAEPLHRASAQQQYDAVMSCASAHRCQDSSCINTNCQTQIDACQGGSNPTGPKTCGDLITCMNDCADSTCEQSCLHHGVGFGAAGPEALWRSGLGVLARSGPVESGVSGSARREGCPLLGDGSGDV